MLRKIWGVQMENPRCKFWKYFQRPLDSFCFFFFRRVARANVQYNWRRYGRKWPKFRNPENYDGLYHNFYRNWQFFLHEFIYGRHFGRIYKISGARIDGIEIFEHGIISVAKIIAKNLRSWNGFRGRLKTKKQIGNFLPKSGGW